MFYLKLKLSVLRKHTPKEEIKIPHNLINLYKPVEDQNNPDPEIKKMCESFQNCSRT